MSLNRKYGVVYTPERLANFVASLIIAEATKDNYKLTTVLDPACGEGALLKATQRAIGIDTKLLGIDVDNEVISNLSDQVGKDMTLICKDAILPPNIKGKTSSYWKRKFPHISAVIANPPWSSEKIYDNSSLINAGFGLNSGQFDSYVLFIELAYKILEHGGYFGFILPDSLFDSQNEYLRRFLTENTQIRVIARLGEKIFDEVNRATTVIVCRKDAPSDVDITMCFRLNTSERKEFLASDISLEHFYHKGQHPVKQLRFLANVGCNFDIDTKLSEEALLEKITKNRVDWNSTFQFGRGVEVSKKGGIVICPDCNHAQGYTKAQVQSHEKQCVYCSKPLPLTPDTLRNIVSENPFEGSERILVGENVKRYSLVGESYIGLNVPGINYKNRDLYVPPKILIRKTGLGIYACVDYSGGMTSQTVYIIKYKNDEDAPPLEYYLALLNSRVVYYYYLKVYGENEWKSHPYFTKNIIFSLPLKKYDNSSLSQKISKISKQLSKSYDFSTDLLLEDLIIELYELSYDERILIEEEMHRLPNLSAINCMKFEGGR